MARPHQNETRRQIEARVNRSGDVPRIDVSGVRHEASDGRLRLHNDAFARFWNVTAADLDQAYDFDGVVELCVPRLHDQLFWRELKGRVTDPDPSARIPISGETKSSDDRIIACASIACGTMPWS